MSNTKGTSVISAPKGGGAQSGLGEKFSPDLFTGTGNFSVPIAVPPGRNGFQPELSLSYSSGNSNGPFGLGWSLSVPGVTRKTSKGIPVYDDLQDEFILSGAEDLVVTKQTSTTTLGVAWEKTYYRPRTEGLFARIIRHRISNGEHYWEVRSKDGLISFYGTPGATSNDPAVVANPAMRNSIFSWHLSKTVDPSGNEIVYSYIRDLQPKAGPRSFDQLYLSSIKYCNYGSSPNWQYLHELRFEYDERPDPFSTYKQGFEIRTTRRCISIETWSNAVSEKTRSVIFSYSSSLHNKISLLTSVTVEGLKGLESESMPPLVFSYSEFQPDRRSFLEVNGPLPYTFLSEPGYELVDVTGNGLPDLLFIGAAPRYWPNKGNAKFGNPKPLPVSPAIRTIPSSKGEGAGLRGMAFIDANGDGRTDLMVLDGPVAGYFPGAFGKVWEDSSFRPFRTAPSFNLGDPEVQLIDLDGDGVTDILRNGNKFECFYNDPELGFNKVRTAQKSFTDFSFADPRIRFADMTGDGMQDIVFMTSGKVTYWPNLGYGRFGDKIVMTNAPRFPEQYNPSQILLGDLDGDGQADIAYVDNNSVTLYCNQSGNGFSEGIKIGNTPMVRDPKVIRIVDLLGTGQAGILWTMGGNPSTPGKMFFLDFTRSKEGISNKPYVLSEMVNNMGSVTRVRYGSSVSHYLRDDKSPATRWQTELPFPVQVVEKVEVIDLLSGGKMVTEYKYHHGYWDGHEREFRGFAGVDAYDTETFDRYSEDDLFPGQSSQSGSLQFFPIIPGQSDRSRRQISHSPPTLTRSWFYPGPVGDGFSRWAEPDFSHEYWQQDKQVFSRPSELKALLASLTRPWRREALRTFRGTLLRSELYSLDGSALESRPYTVTESAMALRLVFPITPALPNSINQTVIATGAKQSHGVFFPFSIAQRTTQYERGNDPLHSFSFTKSYDEYGQPTMQIAVSAPRGSVPCPVSMSNYTGPYNGAVGNYLGTTTITDYIHVDDLAGLYMVNRVARTVSFDATYDAQSNDLFTFENWASVPFANTLTVISCTLNYYDGTSPFVPLAYGKIGDKGLLIHSEQLIFTATELAAYSATPECFVGSPTWSTYLPAFVSGLQNADLRLGYRLFTASATDKHITGWYATSVRNQYNSLGQLIETKDFFDALSDITYDTYSLFPESAKQYLASGSLETSAVYDYRAMQPSQIKDANDNVSVFDYSPLGLLRATALIGKAGAGGAPLQGDQITATPGDFYSMYEPSVRLEYDFFAFIDTEDPVWVKTISREKHYVDSASSDTIEKVEYSDGVGRLLQTRVQAEDLIFGNAIYGSSGLPEDQTQNANAVGTLRSGLDPLNVVVSGFKLYNNKGKVIQQWEPYFAQGFDYNMQGPKGQSVRMLYDSIGRLTETINPDNSRQLIVFGIPITVDAITLPVTLSVVEALTVDYAPSPWVTYTYDANDLADLTHPGGITPPSHYYTPKSEMKDALGRTIKTTEHIDDTSPGDNVVMQYIYDIRGNLLRVIDPLGRLVFRHWYDLRPAQKGEDGKAQPLPPIKTTHLDKGTTIYLFDAAGKPIETTDAKLAQVLSGYDLISRAVALWALDNGSSSITLRQELSYGDGLGTTSNQRGKLYQHYDEAGLLEFSAYDFKGNVLTKSRQVISDTDLQTALISYNPYLIDWTSPPSLSSAFITDMAYDALNRVISIELPTDVAGNRKFILPEYNRAGALEKVSYDSTEYVENIAYNAKGQRLLITFGNTIMTRYVYDKKTFRLIRQKSEGWTKSTVGAMVTYSYSAGTKRQDEAFDYDLAGNILKIFDRMSDCGISNPDELDREFEYDPLYRLTRADGRESNPYNHDTHRYVDVPLPSGLTDVRDYSRTYSYDKLGNILSLVQPGAFGFTRNFNYNSGSNTVDNITAGASTYTFTYDAVGNQLTSDSSHFYSWNHADQLRNYTNGATPTLMSQYDYDVSGKRVSKLVRTGGGSPVYARTIYIDGIFEYVSRITTSTTYEKNYIHIMDDESRIAEFRINIGTSFPGDISDGEVYNLENQIGSSFMRLDTSGAEIDREEYYPYGDSSLRTFTYKRYRYVGKERDGESGLYYYGARYYVAWTCRFLSIDPKTGETPGWTPYHYCHNNPVNLVDKDGMQASEPQNTSPVQNPQHGDSRTINGCTDYWDSAASNGKGAWVDMPEVEVVAQKSNASKEWKDFITNLGSEGYKNFVTELYESKLAPYKQDTGLNREFYGTDELGNINVPDSIKDKLRSEAEKEAMPTLKAMWATEKSGIDPNSVKYSINPLARAQYLSTRALAVSSTEEGKELVGSVLLDVSLQWLGAFKATGQSLSVWATKRSGGGGIAMMNNGERVIGFDWHRFKIGGKKTGTFVNRPHIDIPAAGVKHFPWHQIDKAKRGVN